MNRKAGLREEEFDPDPFRQFQEWYREAQQAGGIRPDAMALATATTAGEPSARMVLLKGFDQRGFTFYTNYESLKGREIKANPRAALVFYWAELERQVRASGSVSRLSQQESETYFRTRPIESQASAWVSRQSQVIPSRQGLVTQFEQSMASYRGRAIPLPPDWGGFLLSPDVFEFWQNQPNRLHDRLRYRRQPGDGWRIERLAP